jgi:Methyltransferase domain
MQIDPYEHDPGRWGASLATHAELVLGMLDAVRPRHVLEVGAYAGDLTRLLADWAARSGARVTAIDPYPKDALVRLAEERAELELIGERSQDALRHVSPADVAIIDGDHNYYTVSEELRLIRERAPGSELPLLLLHDVCWPHARRDSYYEPESIPADYRQPMVEGAQLFPGEPGLRVGGLPFTWAAEREGGPRNGVLTAVEDFLAGHGDLRLAIVPAFFGLGVVWPTGAPWAGAVAELVEPWDRSPLLERLEGSRALHLASSHVHLMKASRQEAVLRRLLDSSAFALAERLSRVRLRLGIGTEHSALSKDEVRRALAD